MISTKSEIRNPKQMENHNIQDSKQYDLEDRTLAFAREVRNFIKEIPRTIANIEDAKQLLRASGSVGANNSKLQDKCHGLVQEAKELMMIFSAIMRNSQ